VHESAGNLAGALTGRADKTHTSLHNIVAMASKSTIHSDSFAPLMNADINDRPFLTVIDPVKLMELYEQYGELSSKQLYINLTSLLYLTLQVAAGKEPPREPWINYNSALKILELMPSAEIKDYETGLKEAYKGEVTALQAA
ncbi:MAG: hypothetical protein Q7S30_02070, partial [Candidatus Omnitrophota bacterium]|nr:hypothetical protein [Candidatus Omnitrophota bacterium]